MSVENFRVTVLRRLRRFRKEKEKKNFLKMHYMRCMGFSSGGVIAAVREV